MSDRSQTAVVFTLLPGPDRKRVDRPYAYRLIYRNPDAEAAGCVMLWEVDGGRLLYQVALERDESGAVRFHCSCADAVFRCEPEGRLCKHVRGLLDIGRRSVNHDGPISLGA
jgi:hypothetical protein